MGRLEGRTALVTGIASGIGAATAQRFAAEGARVAGIDLAKPAAGHGAVSGQEAPAFREADICDEEGVRAAVASLVDEVGPLDILVNAAGVSGFGSAHALEAAEWDRVLDINLKGSFIVSKHVLPGMMERGSGNIIHLASVEGLAAINSQLAYNASKGGVVLMTKSMALDYAPMGIRVNCVCPGAVDTPMTEPLKAAGLEAMHAKMTALHPMGRFAQPSEIAAAILFLASDDASFVTGSALVVDGGFTAGHRLSLD